MNNKYDSDYEIRLATLEAMGGDVSKRYDSVYEIDLEILRLTEEGGGGGSKGPSIPTYKSVDGLPYLTFTAMEDSTIRLLSGFNYPASSDDYDFEYSKDNGLTWNKYNCQYSNRLFYWDLIELKQFESVMFRGDNTRDISVYSDTTTVRWSRFVMTGKIAASGSIESLMSRDCVDKNPYGSTYYGLFMNCNSLITPPELPRKTVRASAYHLMFQKCTNLKYAPELPATTLGSRCYAYMFDGCTSLTETPVIHAEPGDRCYMYMFNGCTNLRKITYLAYGGFGASFYDRSINNNNGLFIKSRGAWFEQNEYNEQTEGIPYQWIIIDDVYPFPKNTSISEGAISIENYGQTSSLNGDKVFLTDGQSSTIELHANGDFYDVNWGREPVVISRNIHDFIFSSPGKIIKLTQEEYDALEEKEETTLYIIK